MLTRDDFMAWVIEALNAHGGTATVLDVSRHVWKLHEAELRAAGDLFYTWQYDIRWAATKLRRQHKMREAVPGLPWALV
jgi:hypothetical protein